MINFSSDRFKLQPRTVKSALKKLKMEDKINESNRYSENIAIKICEYIIKHGTDNTKLSAGLALQEIQNEIAENERKKAEAKPIIHHEFRNNHYAPKNQENIDYANYCIYNDKWNKEYEEFVGYSIIAKDLAGDYALTHYPKKDKKTESVVTEILHRYETITKHMKEENLNFEDIATRYCFRDTVEILPIVKLILDTEMEK